MIMPTADDLYACYDKLADSSIDLKEKEDVYKIVLEGVKGEENVRRLSSQFIARFSKLFEDLLEDSFNCFLDLCDDDDVNVRSQVVHDLLLFCKHARVFVPRVADVLVQMYQTDDKKELNVISLALSQLLLSEPKPTLLGVFNRLLSMNAESSRENALKFLCERLKNLPDDILTSDLESFVVEQTNRVLHDVSEEEFPVLISLLSSLKCMSTLTGRQKLVGMISQQALQAVPVFSATDRACIAQVRESCKQAALCISKNVNAHDLYIYMLEKFLPQFGDFAEDTFDERLSLLQLTSELLFFPSPALASVKSEDMVKYLNSAFNVLLMFLPNIPSEDVIGSSGLISKDKATVNHMGLKFSELEAALFLCCQLGCYCPQYFGGKANDNEATTSILEDGINRLRTVRPRLQYLSQLAQDYATTISGQLDKDLQSEESKLRIMAHRLMMNIQRMVRCFFHNPPMFKVINLTLSWIQPPVTSVPGTKRPMHTDFGNHNATGIRQPRGDRPLYTPPIGQWSRVETTDSNKGRNRFSRGGRGRGRNS
ncbi:hypothetical protein MN116_005657 [Schistosoma mekongi]|uniref:Apoptosis inhibitor 5 n=1 Tax=Schistosoma mekongi TaxID=38744 RepID=A0AAE2D4H3_SCHME|nr:hypothetical protein MN116_005657 [Schistosoma mekongi]